jgi:hypothetical protein
VTRLRKKDPPSAPTKSGVILEAFVEDVLRGDEDNDESVLGRPTAGAKCAPDGGAGPSTKLSTGTTATRAKARRHSSVASAKSGFTLEMFSKDVVKGDKEDGEFVPGGPTAGAKRASNGGAAATAKLAMSTTAARMNARAKDQTNARQDNPSETGGNPKAPPKSGFPVAAFIENVRSGDEGKGDFILEGPAAAAKGARARNTIATTSRSQRRRPKPTKKRAHAEALPSFVWASVPSGERPTKPTPGAGPTAGIPGEGNSRLQRCVYIPPRDPC